MKMSLKSLFALPLLAASLHAESPGSPAGSELQGAAVSPARSGPNPCAQTQRLDSLSFRLVVESERPLPQGYRLQRRDCPGGYYGRYGYEPYGPYNRHGYDCRPEPDYETIKIELGFAPSSCEAYDAGYYGVASSPQAVRLYHGDYRYDLVIVTDPATGRSQLSLSLPGADGKPFIAARFKDMATEDLAKDGKRIKLGNVSVAGYYTTREPPTSSPLNGRASLTPNAGKQR